MLDINHPSIVYSNTKYKHIHYMQKKSRVSRFCWSKERYKFEENSLGVKRAQAISRKVSVTAKNGGVGEFELAEVAKTCA